MYMLSSGSCSWVRDDRLPAADDTLVDFIATPDTCERLRPPAPLDLLKHPAIDGTSRLLWRLHAGRALLFAVVAIALVVVWLLGSSNGDFDDPTEVSMRERTGLANASARRDVRTITFLDPCRMLLSLA